MTIDKTKLRYLAMAQPEKEWARCNGRLADKRGAGMMYGVEGPEGISDYEDWGFTRAAASFIAAANPATILALLGEIERLQGCENVLQQLASYCGCGGYNAPEVDPDVFARKIMDGINILNDPLAQLAEKRGVERDQLKTENESLRKIISESATACGAAVSTECSLEFMAMLPGEISSVVSRLRKGAARYHWLREKVGVDFMFGDFNPWLPAEGVDMTCLEKQTTDESIDAAMAEEASHDC